jgi:hypothetical protein
VIRETIGIVIGAEAGKIKKKENYTGQNSKTHHAND